VDRRPRRGAGGDAPDRGAATGQLLELDPPPAPDRAAPVAAVGAAARRRRLWLVALALRARSGPPVVAQARPAPAANQVLVRFVLVAKGARKVSVAGDFKRLEPASNRPGRQRWPGHLRRHRADARGAYEYMFLVDGTG
jgi:hypothetical protein